MDRQRRNIFASTVSLSALLVAGACSATATANAQAIFAQIQYLLPLLKMLVIGISIAVPQAAGVVQVVAPYLDNAATVFQTLQATMSLVDARPIVQQISGYATAAVDAVANLVDAAPVSSTLAKFKAEVQEAQAVLALITAFAAGLPSIPVAARVQTSALPLLHR